MGAAMKRKRVQKLRNASRHSETWAEKARRSNWFFVTERVTMVFTIFGLLFAGYGLFQSHVAQKEASVVNKATLKEIEEASAERRKQAVVNQATLKEIEEAGAQRIVELYNVAVDPKTIPAARIQTLAFLVTRKQSLSGINLSCEAVGTVEAQENGEKKCVEGADLWKANLRGADLGFANLEGANLFEADLEGADLWEVNLRGTDLWKANLGGVNLESANLEEAFLSGVNFKDAKELESANFNGAWAWTDDPPKDLAFEIALCVFDEAIHERWIKPDPCITELP